MLELVGIVAFVAGTIFGITVNSVIAKDNIKQLRSELSCVREVFEEQVKGLINGT